MNLLELSFSIEELLLFGINFIIIVILIIMNIVNRKQFNKLNNKYKKFMNGLSDRNIEQLLENHIEKVNEVTGKNREIEMQINHIQRNLLQCIQKVGVVRYCAFENVGSDLSFAIALLDSGDSGMVISSIYARDSSSTYAKPIVKGKSTYVLSAEEIQALDIAKKTNREREYGDNNN